jgi:endoglucanase
MAFSAGLVIPKCYSLHGGAPAFRWCQRPLLLASEFENRLTAHMTIPCFLVSTGSIVRLKNGRQRGGKICLAAAFLSFSLMNLAGATNEALAIRLNTIGYLPQAEKQASIAAACTNFAVVRAADDSKVFDGRVTGPVLDPDTEEQLYTADFSAFTCPGDYQLEVPGVGRSAPFRIAPDVYREPYQTVMLGFYLWRCGTAVSATYHGETFAHDACHTNDAWLDFVGGGHVQKDGTKGWHDAGDYNKYTVNAGLTVGTLLRAWDDFGPQIRKVRLQIPESGGKLPDFLAEVKWEMDWVLTMQADDGSVYHKVSTRRFGSFIMPEKETDPRYFTPWGSEATAYFMGMTAQAARIFRPYDRAFANRCLKASEKSYRFLKAHPDFHRPDPVDVRTGAYEIRQNGEITGRLNGIPNNRLWAAAELWETTGSRDALRDLETRIRAVHGQFNFEFDWDEVKNLGLMKYLSSQRPGRDPALVALVRSNLLALADVTVKNCRQDGYASPIGSLYSWGYNGFVARQTTILMTADRLTRIVPATSLHGATLLRPTPGSVSSRPEYRAACQDALNFILGRNYYCRSFVTGVGFRPPMHPHDRRSAADNIVDPWPGYLVGGPSSKATSWKDEQGDARSNEIAINWNAALVYALAACLPDAE